MDLSPFKVYLGELNRTPLGDLRVAVSDLGLVAVEWAAAQPRLDARLLRLKRPVELHQRKVQPYARELSEYLKGRLESFTIPIDWSVLRPFQLKTLKAVYGIPYGETRTYAEVAAQIGQPNACRAVGGANAANPMPLVIPCHRVIAKNGSLGGFMNASDGIPIAIKSWLLKHESV